MHWEAIGAIAEMIGAAGVIASLIYLAKQISANTDNIAQNTKALVSDRDASSNDTAMDILNSLARDSELASLMMRGGVDAQSLSDIDQFRFSAFLNRIFESHQTYFVQHVKGSVSDELWSYYSGVMDRTISVPGIAAWWRQDEAHFDADYADYINRKFPNDG